VSYFSRGLLVAVVACAMTSALAGTAQAESAGRRVAIGNGRVLYLVCAGPMRPQQPTIVLVSGYHDSSDVWTQDDALSLLPNARGPAVLPALSRTNRVCAYDRPGTVRYVNGFPLTDRSTPVTQPRTIEDIAAELHALLAAARVARPYVLVGHSLGGLIVLFYARTYPDEVRGAVFVDALSPSLPDALGRLWPLYLKTLNPRADKQPLAALKSPASETVDIDAGIRRIRAAPPLRPMPLAVLTKTRPFNIPAGYLSPGLTLAELDSAYQGAQDYFVNLVPTTPHFLATGSEHYIALSQPDLVVSAALLVVRRAAPRI
jgi:pimeloyl-ACP methyl ester carboxylesterase